MAKLWLSVRSKKILAKKKIRASHPALMKAGQNAQKQKIELNLQNPGYQSQQQKTFCQLK